MKVLQQIVGKRRLEGWIKNGPTLVQMGLYGVEAQIEQPLEVLDVRLIKRYVAPLHCVDDARLRLGLGPQMTLDNLKEFHLRAPDGSVPRHPSPE